MSKNTFTMVAEIRQFEDKATEEKKDYQTYVIYVDEVEVIMSPKQVVGRRLLEREVKLYGNKLTCIAVEKEFTDKATREVRKYWSYYVPLVRGINVPVAPKERLSGELLELELS